METTISANELEALFDALPDVVFFVKDATGRYTHANLTLVRRLGLKRREDVIGRSVTELFPATLGGSYASQDRRVLEGEVIENQLEVHIFSNRTPGWCLTFKRPLRQDGGIGGVIGISRDLGQPDGRHPTYLRLRRVLAHLQEHYAENVRVATLAALAELSVAQLERHFRRVFQLTPQQVLTKLRIEAAMRMLQGEDSVAAIGLACGFADQSSFARQFKATVGMPPRDYRSMLAST
ncbi:MAG: AraC family transcriptional regulator [Rhodanobacter sp. 68-29]|uniref:AraC family transcriptional regulator n=1 Tax=Rhodanobacter sp. PCA2 TaxID=2006117 RepID=UPI00086F38C5|nr:AraC family transcriptional regulator [Rhodanobacter sp. PCA2]MBA2079235.1 AraC family transcriptional regulator [Rhodanobacter sp. PCA2]MBN8922180.1 AraC family transcriptional regulator [Rhodanobacter sp.]ODU73475.1 MAG: AraC family transcriptional regulator [Rhodanobacter sp. SCN 69-32]OJY55934.1 MAG: AraC family transcriptional regulator [Rhodanobacter sp. 68-29]